MTAGSPTLTFVRREPVPASAPPALVAGPLAWLRQKLFSSPANTVMTLAALAVVALVLPPLLRFLVIDAVFTGENRDACRPRSWAARSAPAGLRGEQDQLLRLRLVPGRGTLAAQRLLRPDGGRVGWMLWLDAPKRGLGALYFFVRLPARLLRAARRGAGARGCCRADLPVGRHAGDPDRVARRHRRGAAARHPPGALGRRSRLPIVRLFCVIFIEFWRGVPLITPCCSWPT